jgi:hypothetical protein
VDVRPDDMFGNDHDGETMTATTKGFDSQLRPFTQRTVWDRT